MIKTHDVYRLGQRDSGKFYIAVDSFDGINYQGTDELDDEYNSHDEAIRELEERASIAAEADGASMRATNGDTIRVEYAN